MTVLQRLEALEREFADVEARLGDPQLIADQPKFQQEARRHKELDAIVGTGRELRDFTQDLEDAREMFNEAEGDERDCLLYTSPSPRDQRGSRMPSSA